MKWEFHLEDVLYYSENCSDFCSQMETVNSDSNSMTSTLTINTSNMPRVTNMTYLYIVCIVNQTLNGPLDEAQAIEVRPASRLERSETAQLLVFPAPTTPPSPPTTPPTSETTQNQGEVVIFNLSVHN